MPKAKAMIINFVLILTVVPTFFPLTVISKSNCRNYNNHLHFKTPYIDNDYHYLIASNITDINRKCQGIYFHIMNRESRAGCRFLGNRNTPGFTLCHY